MSVYVYSITSISSRGEYIQAMSKKSRLRAQKAKQLLKQKENELYEAEEMIRARNGEKSKSVLKYEKAAASKEKGWMKPLKFIMLLPYLINGVFLGTITVIAILFLDLNMPDSKAYLIIGAMAFITVGLVLTFLKKYLAAFLPCAVGTGMFVSVGYSFVSYIQDYMSTHHVDPDMQNMDIKYMLYFYPMLLLGICSLVLFVARIIIIAKEHKRETEKYNNLPVKSIIDD